jgi:hypothetical protein
MGQSTRDNDYVGADWVQLVVEELDADIDTNIGVNLYDFAKLASWWTDDQCQTSADCIGADIKDLKVLVQQ